MARNQFSVKCAAIFGIVLANVTSIAQAMPAESYRLLFGPHAPFVDIEVATRPMRFLLDTKSAYSFIAAASAKAFETTGREQTRADFWFGLDVRATRLSLSPSARILPPIIYETDLLALPYSWRANDVDGVLGQDFLQGRITELNFRDGYILQHSAFSCDSGMQFFVVSPQALVPPTVVVKLDGRDILTTLNTIAADDLEIDSRLARKLHISAGRHHLTVGPHQVADATVKLVPNQQWRPASLGLRALRRLAITFDYLHGRTCIR